MKHPVLKIVFVICVLTSMFNNSINAQDLINTGADIMVKQGTVILVSKSLNAYYDSRINNNGVIKILNNWNNNASADLLISSGSSGKVEFCGISGGQQVSGTSKTVFNDLSVNNTGTGVYLDQDIDISGDLTMTQGKLYLENASLDLGNTGQIINETEANRISVSDNTSMSGKIIARADINNTSINPGNIGLEVSTSGNMGETTITRSHREQMGSGIYSGNYSACRTYEIIPSNVVDGVLNFHYWEAELSEGTTPHIESELTMYHDNTYFWEPLATDVYPSDNKVVSNTVEYSTFTLGSESKPLPVEIVSVNASWDRSQANAAVISWETASESNIEYYKVEFSDMPEYGEESWDSLTSRAAYNTPKNNRLKKYSVSDHSPNYNGIRYYRVKSVEFNGISEQSDIVYLLPQKSNILQGYEIYPNPADDMVKIKTGHNNAGISITIYDLCGKQIRKKSFNNTDPDEIIFDVSEIFPGVYFMVIEENGKQALAVKISII